MASLKLLMEFFLNFEIGMVCVVLCFMVLKLVTEKVCHINNLIYFQIKQRTAHEN